MTSENSHYKISTFIEDIVKTNIIQFNKTVLSCGRTSSYYADFRQLLGYPDLRNYIVEQIIKIINAMQLTGGVYDTIAGVAVAGVPWATLVGNKLNKPISIIRLNEKTHGKKSAIDGAPIKIDDQVILIEDVLTTGNSVINAIRKIHNTGAVVSRVICILDRCEGAQEHINYYFPDVKVSSILTIDTITSVCYANKLINEYIVEQIEFYRESGYTETIKLITRLNDELKEKDYQKEPVKWHIDNYSDIWNFIPSTLNSNFISGAQNNPLIVDVSNITDWNEIKYKIGVIGERVRNLVITFDNIINWNGDMQEELIALHKKFGFNIIYKSAECISQSCVINTTEYTLFNTLNTIQSGCKYPNYVLTNGIIVNLYIDTNPSHILVTHLCDAIKKYEVCNKFNKLKINNIFVNLVGPGVGDLITNIEFWEVFRRYILNIINNQKLQIKGIIIPYTYIKNNTHIINRQLAFGKLIPLILDISYNSVFYLEPSMLSDNVNTDYIEYLLAIVKTFNGNGFTHLMVGSDLLQSNTTVETRIEQYINFIKQLVSQNKKKAFNFIQLSDAYMKNNGCKPITDNDSEYNDVFINDAVTNNAVTNTVVLKKDIESKVDEFINKITEHKESDKLNIKNEVESTGIVQKCKEYLFLYTNKVFNIFGLSLTPTK